MKTRKANSGWIKRYRNAVAALPAGEYTGEIVRLAVATQIGNPKHPNTWGVSFRAAVERGEFRPTDRFRPMITSRSHARTTRIYERQR
jgi:hypothetical protein